MTQRRWCDLYLPAVRRDAAWELFHENSKLSPFDPPMSDEQAAALSGQIGETLHYSQYPAVKLPEELDPISLPLSLALARRSTPAALERRQLTLQQLAVLLYCAYGVTDEAGPDGGERSQRTVPSAGSLYPLELYFHTRSVDGLPPGLYHFNPVDNELRRLRDGDQTAKLGSALVHKHLAVTTSLVLFVGAMFERTVKRHDERGYRYALLEAGHVAQNLGLAAVGLGLGCVHVGEYHDRKIDALLGFDGLSQSTVYMAAIGGVAG